ncbi:diguanylate cyclase [Paraglaciecola marina]|uniref:sensor domain-containing diguanylate cyclase n=1 Tax=Paraglaciecola marina TaxID=2500157 RepID=UPI00105BF760|nr:diguanylate cyclase [Paraglaciecola marina]
MIDQRLELKTLPSKVLSIILFLMTTVLFSALIFHFGIALKPSHLLAKDGELTFQENYFKDNKITSLAGEWAFFEGQLVEPQNIQNQINDATIIQGTDGWSLNNSTEGPVLGYGTYHLRVHLLDSDLNLALQIPKVETAYKLFLDEKLVASAGVVATSVEKGIAEFKPTIVIIPKHTESFSLTIQVSNFHSAWGGLWSPIVLGNTDSIYSVQRDLVALSMFIIGALVVTTAFYLIQYYFRPDEKIPLAFACLCLIFLLREFTAEHMYFVLEYFSIGYSAALKLNYLTFYLGVLNVLYFMHLCFPRVFNINISRFFYVIGISYSLFILFSPVELIGYSLMSYQLFSFIVMLYTLINMLVANITKQPTAKMMAFSAVVLSLFAINDILYANSILDTGPFFNLGIVGFIICQSYVINQRFNNVISNNEALSMQLQQSNSELQLLGAELENKVELRTKQLEKANFELDKLARSDKLTGLLNRHGLHPYLQRTFDNSKQDFEPFCIVLYDFDNFKYINDTYGHDLGDTVLINGAKILKGKIRKQDKLARWGGEEFLVYLPSTDLAGAMAIAEKLRLAIENMQINQGGVNVPVTITGGVAELEPEDTFEALFKRADNALYKGKNLGRNCIQN